MWGREAFIHQLWERLDQNSLLLVAPRRFGKTSVMHALCDRPREPWTAVYVDAEHTRTPGEFAVTLVRKCAEANPTWSTALRAALDGARSWWRAAVSSVGLATSYDTQFWLEVRRDMGQEWESRSLELLRTLRGAGAQIVFAIDELAIMLENFQDQGLAPAEVRGFMRWFRHLRIDPSDGLRGCRFVLGSSIGIEGALSRIGAVDTINDLQPVVLEELSPEDGRALLCALLAGAGVILSRPAVNRALELVGPPVPYFVQIMAHAITRRGAGSRIGPKAIEAVYEAEVLGAHARTYFEHYYDRLRRLDPIDHRLALAVLKHLAGARSASRRALWMVYDETAGEQRTVDDFEPMLKELENDFYIRYDPSTGEYAFWSNMLRDWWRRHYGM